MNLYLTKKENKLFFYTLNDFGHIYDFYPEEMLAESTEGSFYMGIVKDMKNALSSAFVEIGEENVGFLPYSEMTEEVHCGQHILVQSVRNSKDKKGSKLTMKYSFEGVYCVLLCKEQGVFYSNKMKQALKEEIKAFLADKELPYGYIIRSAVDDTEKLWKEMQRLSEQASTFLGKAQYQMAPKLLQKSSRYDFLKNVKELEEIYTNDKEIFEDLVAYLKEQQLSYSAHFREEDYYIRHDIVRAIQDGLNRKVWLSSGAYLIIEKTEAMNVIDVNTGKSKGSKDNEKTNLKINLEAAKEIARQLRLRNLSGIILVDFINLKKEENKEILTKALTELTAKDTIPTQVHGLTKLGIMEITRKKKYETLEEWWSREARDRDRE